MNETGDLTGKVRFRRGWWGKLVLQVELSGHLWSEGGGGCYRHSTWYRDATEMDFASIAIAGTLV